MSLSEEKQFAVHSVALPVIDLVDNINAPDKKRCQCKHQQDSEIYRKKVGKRERSSANGCSPRVCQLAALAPSRAMVQTGMMSIGRIKKR
jgi:hypothetical protein